MKSNYAKGIVDYANDEKFKRAAERIKEIEKNTDKLIVKIKNEKNNGK